LPEGVKKKRQTSGRSVSGWFLTGHIPKTSLNHRLSHCSVYILLQSNLPTFRCKIRSSAPLYKYRFWYSVCVCVCGVYLYFVEFSVLKVYISRHTAIPFHTPRIPFLLFGVDAVNRLIRMSHCSTKYVLLPWIVLKEKQRRFCCRR
jgi:hypothetical protein